MTTTDSLRSLLPFLLPHAVAVLAMFLVSAFLMAPAMLEDKRLRQGDIQNNIGMSKESRDLQAKDGEVPHWTDAMFGGMPTIQITGPGLNTAPKLVWKSIRAAMPMEVATLTVAMLSAYILGLCLGLSPWMALVLGLGFGLSSLNVLYLAAGHATKVRAIATMPGVLAGTLLAFRGKPWRGAGVAALFAALHLSANHVQMTYYLLFMLVAVAVAAWIHAAWKGTLATVAKATGLLMVGGLLAAIPQTGQLSLTEQYAAFTTRGDAVLPSDNEGSSEGAGGLSRDYILEYSMARGEFWSLAIPNVKGGNNPLYWGEQRFSGGAFYFGALAFALCLAWWLVGSHWLRFPTLLVSLMAVVLSWRDASGLTDVFLDHLPLFDKFRDTKMMLVLVQLVVPLGAAMALHEASQSKAQKQWKRWAFGGGVSVLLMVLFYVAPQFWFDFKSSIRPDMAMEQMGNRAVGLRIELFRSDVLRAMGLSTLALLALLALVKSWLEARWVMLCTAALVAMDMVSIDRRYLGEDNFEPVMTARFPFEASPADRAILAQESQFVEGYDEQVRAAEGRWEDKLGTRLTRRFSKAKDAAAFEVLQANSHYRVMELANPFNDARTSYFHKSVGGYHGAKLRRYQDFIERVLTPERATMIQNIQAGQYKLGADMAPGCAMMNVRYLMVPGAQQPLPFQGGLGPAWWVKEVQWVTGPEEELNGISQIDPSEKALMHSTFREALGDLGDPGISSAKLLEYHPDGSRYEVQSERGGLLVLSEVHYPLGWSATVDGVPTELVRVNYILQGLKVPSGEHEVILHFEPQGWGTARLLSHAGSALWMLWLGLAVFFGRREVGTKLEH